MIAIRVLRVAIHLSIATSIAWLRIARRARTRRLRLRVRSRMIGRLGSMLRSTSWISAFVFVLFVVVVVFFWLNIYFILKLILCSYVQFAHCKKLNSHTYLFSIKVKYFIAINFYWILTWILNIYNFPKGI